MTITDEMRDCLEYLATVGGAAYWTPYDIPGSAWKACRDAGLVEVTGMMPDARTGEPMPVHEITAKGRAAIG